MLYDSCTLYNGETHKLTNYEAIFYPMYYSVSEEVGWKL